MKGRKWGVGDYTDSGYNGLVRALVLFRLDRRRLIYDAYMMCGSCSSRRCVYMHPSPVPGTLRARWNMGTVWEKSAGAVIESSTFHGPRHGIGPYSRPIHQNGHTSAIRLTKKMHGEL